MTRRVYSMVMFQALVLGLGGACGADGGGGLPDTGVDTRPDGLAAEVHDGTTAPDSDDGDDDSAAPAPDGAALDTLPDATGADAGGDASADAIPDAQPDGVPPPDATGPGLAVGEACSDDDDCSSGWCVPSALGVICVDVCRELCANDWSCIPASGVGPDETYLCVPLVAPEDPPGDTVGGGGTADTSADTSEPPADAVADGVPGDTVPDDSVIADAGPSDGGSETIGDDSDGDGIPDDEDNLPCVAIYLVVFNENVTSASLSLNGVEAISANEFPTLAPIQRWLNPVSGMNTLSLGGKLTGSPSDTLTLVVLDTAGRVYFSTVIIREPGPPREHSYTFEVDVTCE